MPYTPTFEDEFEVQRQLLLFHDVIKHLEKRGFKLEDEAKIPLCYYCNIVKQEYTFVELSEFKGKTTISVDEAVVDGDHRSSTFWEERTDQFNAVTANQRIDDCFFITNPEPRPTHLMSFGRTPYYETREEEIKLFFMDLLLQLEANGYEDVTHEDQLLTYEKKNAIGVSTIRPSFEKVKVCISLSEYSYDRTVWNFEDNYWFDFEYTHQKGLLKIKQGSQIVVLEL